MIALSLCCAAVGTALGMRFTVVGLIFAAFLAFCPESVGFGIAANWGVLATAMALATSLVTLELGYLVGSYFGRWFVHWRPTMRWTPRLPGLVHRQFRCTNAEGWPGLPVVRRHVRPRSERSRACTKSKRRSVKPAPRNARREDAILSARRQVGNSAKASGTARGDAVPGDLVIVRPLHDRI